MPENPFSERSNRARYSIADLRDYRITTQNVVCEHCNFCVVIPLHNPDAGRSQPFICPNCNMPLGCQCSECNAYTRMGDLTHSTVLNRDICNNCLPNHVLNCCYCGREVRNNRAERYQRLVYCSRCFNELFFECCNCNNRHPRSTARRLDNDALICEDCHSNEYVCCDGCSRSITDDEAVETENGIFCQRCERNNAVWEPNQFSVASPTYDQIGSERRFGIELETSRCTDHREIRQLSSFGSKTDPSIEGMEFISPILYGDQGLAEIQVLCNFAERKRWQISRYCGYHVHFDMRDETPATLKRIAYAYALTYTLWTHFVSDARAASAYAGPPDYSADSIYCIDDSDSEEWDYFVGARDRFEYANWRAYLSHGTFEIRLYEGTLNSEEIINWLKVHALFIDGIVKMSLDEIKEKFEATVQGQFEALTAIIGEDLANYWNDKAGLHNKRISRARPTCTLVPPF